MLVVHRRRFVRGAVLAAGFFAVLALAFTPIFGSRNAFQAADDLFNSIAKGSSNYVADLRSALAEAPPRTAALSFTLADAESAARARRLLAGAGLQANGQGTGVSTSGAITAALNAALADAEAMFHNRGEEVARRHGYAEREVLVAWWTTLTAMRRTLEDQERFADAAAVDAVLTRGVEVAYNFYGIEPWRASDHALVLAGALAFYVVYTLWWGFAIMYLFDGLGLEMKKAAAKQEV